MFRPVARIFRVGGWGECIPKEPGLNNECRNASSEDMHAQGFWGAAVGGGGGGGGGGVLIRKNFDICLGTHLGV